jgi:hypothetical protein
MAQETDAQLQTQREEIEKETITGANTTTRVGDMLENIIDSKINNDKIVDEDNMASDSATLVPTQQSVKAYVDASAGASDWGEIGGTLSNQTVLQTALNGKVNDTGDETIAGIKTFSSDPIIPDEVYDATAWNGSLEPPTKNAVRDFIEANAFPYTPADELTEIAGLTLESDITVAQLLEALDIPGCIPIHIDALTSVTLTNMTNALAVFPLNSSLHYVKFHTTNIRRMRLNVRVNTTSASANNPRMYIQYSINGGSSYVTLGAGTIASGDAISLFTGASAVQVTNWITLPAEAKGDSFIWRVVTEGGDGAADPQIGNVLIEFTT